MRYIFQECGLKLQLGLVAQSNFDITQCVCWVIYSVSPLCFMALSMFDVGIEHIMVSQQKHKEGHNNGGEGG